ncbi:MAG: hypothetical protein K9N51_04285 [Candidatus Pacebacteria bacterium]|nr:hypothetical protein [Candidatus Paceibacterota bacterium]
MPLRSRGWRSVLTILSTVLLAANAVAAWHHSASPYRCRFAVTAPPNHPRAGLAVSVPICGVTSAEGNDLFAFESTGRQLQILSLGASPANRAAALVEPPAKGTDIYVYFGSTIRAPQNRTAFLEPLTLSVYSLPGEPPLKDWPEVERLLRTSDTWGTLFADQIALRHNPVNAADAFIMDFTGHLRIPEDGEYTFMLVSDDAGFLFIDQELCIERTGRGGPGNMQRGEYRKTVTLKSGTCPVRCVVAEAGNSQTAVLARWIDERNKYILKPEDFVQPGRTELKAVETRTPDAPCPLFWYTHVSYIGVNGLQYTETELGTHNQKPAQWRLGDGSVIEGAKIRHVFHGLDSRRVQVRQGDQTAEGTIAFPENPPARRHIANPGHFNHYAGIILATPLKGMELPTLKAYRSFLLYREFNPDVIPVTKAVLNHSGLNTAYRYSTLMNLAALSTGVDAKTAETAFNALLTSVPDNHPKLPEVLLEFAWASLFQLDNLQRAEKLTTQLQRHLRANDPRLVHLRLDLMVRKGEVEQAHETAAHHLNRGDMGKNQRYAAVKSNALKERFYELLHSGFIDDAHTALWEWVELTPHDRYKGSWPLARARLWTAMHRQKGALAILEDAMTLNPMLVNLPDVEFEKAKILQRLGHRELMTEVCRDIIKNYPNHEVAGKARSLLE